MKKKTIRNILLVVCVPLVLIGMGFLFCSMFYMDRFYPGTWINGIDFSNRTVEDAKDSLIEYKSAFALRIVEADGDQEVIKGSDFDYAESFDAVAGIKKEQGMWHWLPALTGEEFYNIDSQISYNEEKLNEAVKALDCVEGRGVVAPSDAYVEFTDNGVNLVAETYGTLVDGDKLFELVKTALDGGYSRVLLEGEDCYVMPAVTAKSREIREIMAPVEKLTGTTITYTFGDQTEVLDPETLKSWIRKDEEGEVIIDPEKIRAFVQGLADKYNTWGLPKEFVTSYGTTVTVAGGNYGWLINVDKEVEALTELLLNGQSETREPIYDVRAASHGSNEIGDTYIEISIDNQKMWFYKNGSLYVETNIVTGKTSEDYYTPRGAYRVLNRLTNQVLKGNNRDGSTYESPVDYWIGFKGSGYGIHDASWRGDYQEAYGGQIYVYGGSHGCVNTPLSWVREIFNAVEVGTPVMIY